jgi:hypothetical protein
MLLLLITSDVDGTRNVMSLGGEKRCFFFALQICLSSFFVLSLSTACAQIVSMSLLISGHTGATRNPAFMVFDAMANFMLSAFITVATYGLCKMAVQMVTGMAPLAELRQASVFMSFLYIVFNIIIYVVPSAVDTVPLYVTYFSVSTVATVLLTVPSFVFSLVVLSKVTAALKATDSDGSRRREELQAAQKKMRYQVNSSLQSCVMTVVLFLCGLFVTYLTNHQWAILFVTKLSCGLGGFGALYIFGYSKAMKALESSYSDSKSKNNTSGSKHGAVGSGGERATNSTATFTAGGGTNDSASPNNNNTSPNNSTNNDSVDDKGDKELSIEVEDADPAEH